MKLVFTYPEVIDLIKAFVAITLIYWWAAGGMPIIHALPIIAFFVGSAFILHELAHKAMASYYGYESHFKSFDMMLLGSMFLAFFGFIFLAPGAVFTAGIRKMKHLGIISLVGPLTNIVLALICLAISPFLSVAAFGFQINAWLALFNMIPFFGLDGEKILAWDKKAFIIMLVVAGGLYVFAS